MSEIKKAFVYIIEPNKVMLFSVVSSFVGYAYLGKEDSPIYTYLMIALFLLSFVLCIRELVKKPPVRNGAIYLSVVWIIWLSFNLASYLVQYGWDYAFAKYYFFFVVFSLNSLLWGIVFGREYSKNLHTMIRLFEPFVLAVAIFSVLYVLMPFSSSDSTIRAMAYQSNSYYSAFAFGMILFYLFFGKRFERFRVFNSLIIKAIYTLFLVLLPLAVISTGGRGGFVLVFVYVLISIHFLFFSNHTLNLKKIIMAIGFLLGFIVVIVILVSAVSGSKDLRDSFLQTISYLDFSSGRIDMTATSNRDSVYLQAIELISQKPIFGYGVFHSMPKLTTTLSYPHQMFLEFLLQGGVVYTIFACSALVYSFFKLRRLERGDCSSYFMVYLSAYPFTMLMFSGTYLTTSLFWFFLSVILSARYKNEAVQS